MNKARRKIIKAQLEKIDALRGEIELAVDAIISEIESVKDEEQEAFDARPENFQYSEKGEAAQAAISALEDAIGELENLRETDFDSITQSLDTAME